MSLLNLCVYRNNCWEEITINRLDGKLMAQMMISGANNLYNKRKAVDELNVFPVPDGDTGTNMSMTVTAMSKALSELITSSASKTADTMSYATLRGARGNSGVILSQFFRGISKSLKGIDSCSAKQFADALMAGSDAAYKAVMKPTEGTILTVARETAQAAVAAAQNTDDISEVMKIAVKKGYKVLAKTPDMLPALKKAGVVDAGGQGWLFFLDGVCEYLDTGKITESSAETGEQAKEVTAAQDAVDTKNIKYTYCTEFIVEKSSPDVSVSTFRKSIEAKGDCMLVIDDDDIVKVHIHTNNPGYVLEKAVLLGSMINIKIDNMKHQHQSIITQPAENQASSKETGSVPSEEEIEKKDYGFVGICVGDGICDIFKNLGIDSIIEGGQTMNPSTEDIIGAVNKINADTVFVFPNNKNIIMAANQAKDISDKNIVVIPTKTIPQCVSAMLAFSQDKTAEENEQAMIAAIGNVKTGQITYAVRDTEIDDMNIKEGDILGISEKGITTSGTDVQEVTKQLITSMIDDDSEFLTIYYGEDISEDTAEEFAEQLEEEYPDIEVDVKYGGQSLYYYIFSIE